MKTFIAALIAAQLHFGTHATQVSAAEPKPQTADLQRLAEELASQQFGKRQTASRRLLKLGETAIPPAIKAAYSEEAESRVRALSILRSLSRNPDPQIAAKAKRALDEVAKHPDHATALRNYHLHIAPRDEALPTRFTMVITISNEELRKAEAVEDKGAFDVTNTFMTDLIRSQGRPRVIELGGDPDNIGLPNYSDEVARLENTPEGLSGSLTFDLYRKSR